MVTRTKAWLHAWLGHILARLWGTVTEPRAVTLTVAATYALAASAATAVGLRHSADDNASHVLGWAHSGAVWLLALGGGAGAVLAWRGEWALERVAVATTTFGVWLAAIYTACQPSGYGLSTAAALAAACAWTALAVLRWLRVTQATFAPRESTPLSPEQVAAVHAALTQAQARARDVVGGKACPTG